MTEHYEDKFTVKGVTFSIKDSLTMIEVDNEFARATITTHGGCVLSYIPKSGSSANEDILWVSPTALFNGKKPVRGGVPVCWPWFGAHPNEDGPAHGFVRNKTWELKAVKKLPNGSTEITMSTSSDNDTIALWSNAFELELKVEVGEKLVMTLTTFNLNDYDFVITEALHTYFAVADCRETIIEGLDKTTHLDKLKDDEDEIEVEQQGDVVLKPPMDSVYLNQSGPILFDDGARHRKICIEQNGHSAVVWNPGPETVKGFGDIPNETWPTFMCVEAGNILANSIHVESQGKHRFTMAISAV